MAAASSPRAIPVLLLKTRSSPTDAYEELLSTSREGVSFEPVFIPVLEHNFEEEGMRLLGSLLHKRRINRSGQEGSYGGLIFTSQRAVEAFAKLVAGGDKGPDPQSAEWPHLQAYLSTASGQRLLEP